jgi:hypothetical protein
MAWRHGNEEKQSNNNTCYRFHKFPFQLTGLTTVPACPIPSKASLPVDSYLA